MGKLADWVFGRGAGMVLCGTVDHGEWAQAQFEAEWRWDVEQMLKHWALR